MSVLVCGEALWDVFLAEAPDMAAAALAFDGRPGGSPFNVAIGLARLEVPAALFTGLSTDFLGARLDAILAAEGVDRSRVARLPNRTTVSLVGVDAAGGPAYGFYGEEAADRSVTLAHTPAHVPEQALHFGSYSLVARPTADVLAALAKREAGRKLISLDPNIRPTVEPDMEIWRARVEVLARLSAVIKVSDEDLGLLYPGDAVEACVQRWIDGGAGLVAVTRGAAGAEAWTAKTYVKIAAPQTDVIDTVGAGDSFQAALLRGLLGAGVQNQADAGALSAEALTQILTFAARCAAITVSRRGANPPRLSEVV